MAREKRRKLHWDLRKLSRDDDGGQWDDYDWEEPESTETDYDLEMD